jgi:hypothetical protein
MDRPDACMAYWAGVTHQKARAQRGHSCRRMSWWKAEMKTWHHLETTAAKATTASRWDHGNSGTTCPGENDVTGQLWTKYDDCARPQRRRREIERKDGPARSGAGRWPIYEARTTREE